MRRALSGLLVFPVALALIAWGTFHALEALLWLLGAHDSQGLTEVGYAVGLSLGGYALMAAWFAWPVRRPHSSADWIQLPAAQALEAAPVAQEEVSAA